MSACVCLHAPPLDVEECFYCSKSSQHRPTLPHSSHRSDDSPRGPKHLRSPRLAATIRWTFHFAWRGPARRGRRGLRVRRNAGSFAFLHRRVDSDESFTGSANRLETTRRPGDLPPPRGYFCMDVGPRKPIEARPRAWWSFGPCLQSRKVNIGILSTSRTKE